MPEPATLNDMPRIVEMWQEMRDSIGLPTTKTQVDKFHLDLVRRIYTDIILVEREKDDIIGFIVGALLYNDYEDFLSGMCDYLYVIPSRRDGHVVDLLINALSCEMIERGAKKLQFATKYMPRRNSLWERYGFKAEQIIYAREVD